MFSLVEIKLFKKKGALVVLLWMFSSQYIMMELILSDVLKSKAVFFSTRVGIIVSVLVYPFFGWLADVHYGRYKVIKYSLHISWLISVFYCLVLVVLNLLSAYGVLGDLDGKQHAINVAWYLVLGLGVGGLVANVVQFGLDQLLDPSSSEVTSYVRWSGLTWVLSIPLVRLVRAYLASYFLIHSLVIPALLSMMLCLDYFCVSWFVMEPVSKDPLVTIFQVLKFAVKNKYPRLRSAYSYWNSSFCSRIDLAKSEYGGPFTAEQVEDTKAFWRILTVMCFASCFASMCSFITGVEEKEKYLFRKVVSAENVCAVEFLVNILIAYSGTVIIALFLPFFELLVSSRIKVYIDSIPMLRKVSLGMMFILFAVCGYGILEAVGHYQNCDEQYKNNTCVLDFTKYEADSVFSLNYKWFVIPRMLDNFGRYVLLITAGEFLCAQSPYSMKGLLFGLLFGFMGAFSAINYAWLLPFQMAIRESKISAQIGCGTVYFFSILLILVLITACFCCAGKCYKHRQRDQVERHEYSIDIDSYS